MSEEVQQEPRQVMVDDVSYVVDELPQELQGAIATYDVWMADQREAQKTAAQMTAATQQLAAQITNAIKAHVAAQEAEAEGVASAGEDALDVVDAEASAALDIPAEEE